MSEFYICKLTAETKKELLNMISEEKKRGCDVIKLKDLERSKREDALDQVAEWGDKFESAMRCSEQSGNRLREVQ